MTCAQLGAALEDSRVPASMLIADLARVGFFDAAGLSALLVANTRCAQFAARLGVVPSRAVDQVIELAGARAVLSVYPDVRRAVASAAAPAQLSVYSSAAPSP